MSKVLISGYYGFANAGDEAMLSAIILALKAKHADMEIVVISGDAEATASVYGIRAIPRFDATSIFNELRSCDLLISGGGSLLQDITSRRSLLYYLSIIQLARLMGKKVMLYGHGIGPLNGRFARMLTGFVCRQVSCISVRDNGSAVELQDLGVDSENIAVTADPVFAMSPVDKEVGKQILARYGFFGEKFTIGISVRPWKELKDYKRVLAEVADMAVEKYNARILFLPLHNPQDAKVSREIVSMMRNRQECLVLETACSTTDFLSITGNMDLLIGVRLHALVFAAVMQVPIIGISYDPKIDRFLEGIQAKAVACMRTLTQDILAEKVSLVIDNLEKEKATQSACVDKLRLAAEDNASMAVELLLKK